MRRLVELGWNDKMTMSDIAHAFGGTPSAHVVRRHINEHKANGKEDRDIPIPPIRPTRLRVEELQKKMLDEIESRIQWAEERSAIAKANGNEDVTPADWFDLLDPKVQSSIASVLKMQGLTDKREQTKATVAVDVMRLMGGVAPPAHLIEDGATIAGEYEEVLPEVHVTNVDRPEAEEV